MDIKANGSILPRIPARISLKKAGRTLYEILKNGNEFRYMLHLRFKIRSDNNTVKNSQVALESSGAVKSLLKTGAKK